MSTYINILASSCFTDASGALIASGELRVTPSSPFQVGGGGQALSETVTRKIVNGSISAPLQLANPALTAPTGIGYTFTVSDSRTGHTDTYADVLITSDANGDFDLAQLNTGQFVPAVPQTVISVSGGQAQDNQILTLTSGAQTISAYTVVALVGGSVVTASSGIPAHMGAVVGVATQSVAAGAPVQIQFAGQISYNGWTFQPGEFVCLSSTGILTQTVPAFGFLQVLGVAITPTSVLLSIQPAISIQ